MNPVPPGQARRLLKQGKAAVFRRYPFTIILKKEVTKNPKNITLKIDPGSKFTGIALVQDNQVIWGADWFKELAINIVKLFIKKMDITTVFTPPEGGRCSSNG